VKLSETSFSPSSSKYKYTVSPPLALEFGIPLERFAALHPEYHYFVVGAFIFSPQIGTGNSTTTTIPLSAAEKELSSQKESKWKNENISKSNPAVLILQRSSSDSFPSRWDFPGGSVDFPSPAPKVASTSAAAGGVDEGAVVEGDATILDAVVREVFEETGYRVKHIHALVQVNTWMKENVLKAMTGGILNRDGPLMGEGVTMVVKYSFLVDVYEDDKDLDALPDDRADRVLTYWEDRVKLAPSEHQNHVWATEKDIERSVRWKAAKKSSGPWTAIIPGVAGSDPKAIEEEGPVYDIIGNLASTTYKSFETYRKLLQGN
jgi:8-oxo-dGTP pyrophosphatase MutT (NUDIX family)